MNGTLTRTPKQAYLANLAFRQGVAMRHLLDSKFPEQDRTVEQLREATKFGRALARSRPAEDRVIAAHAFRCGVFGLPTAIGVTQ